MTHTPEIAAIVEKWMSEAYDIDDYKTFVIVNHDIAVLLAEIEWLTAENEKLRGKVAENVAGVDSFKHKGY